MAWLSLTVGIDAIAQSMELYPPHWWTDMKYANMQLLIKGTETSFNEVQVTLHYPGVTITRVTPLDGKLHGVGYCHCVFCTAGDVTLEFKRGKQVQRVSWPLKHRDRDRKYAQGITAADFIYFLMPDRFSNGDPSNDRVPRMRDQSLNRDSIFHWHGGDLQDVINHLDYL